MNQNVALGRFSKEKTAVFLKNSTIYIILVLIIIFIIIQEPSFASLNVFLQILMQASTRIILALGVAGIIIVGGTDLSAGRAVGMAGIIAASLLQQVDYAQRIYPNMPALPLILPLLISIACCVFFNAFQGIMVAKFKVAPFIASLGFQLVIYGLMSVYYDKVNKGTPIGSLDLRYKAFAQGFITVGKYNISYLIFYAIIITAVIWFIWNKTKLGQNMYAIGGNIEAATVCGVPVVWSTILIYILAGVLYGCSGFLEAARTGSATNSLAADYALDAIAACVVGGVSLRGGIGKIQGVIIGVVLFQFVNYGLVYIGVSGYMQYFVRGMIILIAVAIDTQKYVKKK